MQPSPKSAGILQAIIDYKVANDGASPSVRELGRVAGVSPSVVQYHLARLEEAGAIERTATPRARGIKVVGGRWVPPPQVHILADDELSADTVVAIGNMVHAAVTAMVNGKLGKRKEKK